MVWDPYTSHVQWVDIVFESHVQCLFIYLHFESGSMDFVFLRNYYNHNKMMNDH